jgi:fluoride ion exporter CrcB/FEX
MKATYLMNTKHRKDLSPARPKERLQNVLRVKKNYFPSSPTRCDSSLKLPTIGMLSPTGIDFVLTTGVISCWSFAGTLVRLGCSWILNQTISVLAPNSSPIGTDFLANMVGCILIGMLDKFSFLKQSYDCPFFKFTHTFPLSFFFFILLTISLFRSLESTSCCTWE